MLIICRKLCDLHLFVEMHRCKPHDLFLTIDRINQVYSAESNCYSVATAIHNTICFLGCCLIDKKLQINILHLDQKLKFLKISSSAGFFPPLVSFQESGTCPLKHTAAVAEDITAPTALISPLETA